MPNYLSEEDQKREKKRLEEFRANKPAMLEAFEAEWRQADAAAIRTELESLEGYLAACSRSEISDTLDNIRFKREKADILRKLLGED